ncbi:folate family ECF transporter S component [Lacticigenium naphthae]|uniref:folate family ECF transporter S component n=1 Tax=Lacticigenium naphthae TaxID=515351 RepID=UPI000402CDAB|nr:folate family ECF transporter S component [Lacticigenium naphthae]
MLKNKRVYTTQAIAVIGLLMGMDIILTRFLAIQTPFTRIAFGFLPSALIGMLYGPWTAGIAAALTDLLGVVLFNRGGIFFIGFTLSAFLGGWSYGFFLHRKKVTLIRIIAAVLFNTIVVNLTLNTFWLVLMYEEAWMAIFPARVLQNMIIAPVRVVLIYIVTKNTTLQRIYHKHSTAKK